MLLVLRERKEIHKETSKTLCVREFNANIKYENTCMYLFDAAFLGFFFMQTLQNEARLVCKHNSLSLYRVLFFMLWTDQSISCNSTAIVETKLWDRIQLT